MAWLLWIASVVRFWKRRDEHEGAKTRKRFLEGFSVVAGLVLIALMTRSRELAKPRAIDPATADKMQKILGEVVRGEPPPRVSIFFRSGFSDETTKPFGDSIARVITSSKWEQVKTDESTASSSEIDMEGVCYMAQGGVSLDKLDERQEAVIHALELIEGPCIVSIPPLTAAPPGPAAGAIIVGRRSSTNRSPGTCIRRRQSCIEAPRAH